MKDFKAASLVTISTFEMKSNINLYAENQSIPKIAMSYPPENHDANSNSAETYVCHLELSVENGVVYCTSTN